MITYVVNNGRITVCLNNFGLKIMNIAVNTINKGVDYLQTILTRNLVEKLIIAILIILETN